MLRNTRLTLSVSAMAALIAAALLTTSAMARDSQGTSWRHAEPAICAVLATATYGATGAPTTGP